MGVERLMETRHVSSSSEDVVLVGDPDALREEFGEGLAEAGVLGQGDHAVVHYCYEQGLGDVKVKGAYVAPPPPPLPELEAAQIDEDSLLDRLAERLIARMAAQQGSEA